MVEVFKTNVENSIQAKLLLKTISKNFPDYKTNFDLEDCDKVLRMETLNNQIQSSEIINLINDSGFEVSILPDDLNGSPKISNEYSKSLAS